MKTFLLFLHISWQIYFQVSFAFLTMSQCVQTACLHSSQDIFILYHFLCAGFFHLSIVIMFLLIFLLCFCVHSVQLFWSLKGDSRKSTNSSRHLFSPYIYIFHGAYLKKIQPKSAPLKFRVMVLLCLLLSETP